MDNNDLDFIKNATEAAKNIFDTYKTLIELESNDKKYSSDYLKTLSDLNIKIEAEESIYNYLSDPEHALNILYILEEISEFDSFTPVYLTSDAIDQDLIENRVIERLENISNKDFVNLYNTLEYEYIKIINNDLIRFDFFKKYYEIVKKEFNKRFISLIESNDNIKSILTKAKYYTYYLRPELEKEMLKDNFPEISNNFNDCLDLSFKDDKMFNKQITSIFGFLHVLDYLEGLSNYIDEDLFDDSSYYSFNVILNGFKTALLFLDKVTFEEIKNYIEQKFNDLEQEENKNIKNLILEAIYHSNHDYNSVNQDSKIKVLK